MKEGELQRQDGDKDGDNLQDAHASEVDAVDVFLDAILMWQEQLSYEQLQTMIETTRTTILAEAELHGLSPLEYIRSYGFIPWFGPKPGGKVRRRGPFRR